MDVVFRLKNPTIQNQISIGFGNEPPMVQKILIIDDDEISILLELPPEIAKEEPESLIQRFPFLKPLWEKFKKERNYEEAVTIFEDIRNNSLKVK